jgi:uncharacterized Tic20 family protein
MTVNFNLVAALLGCLALIACRVICRKSGIRGLALALCGCSVIVGVTLVYLDPTRFLHLAGIMLALLVLALVLVCIGKVSHARRKHGPRYRPPARCAARVAGAQGLSE